MLTIRNAYFIRFTDDNQTSVIRAEIDVDTADELPDIDGISGRILNQGSTALIIKEGKLAILSGNGKWYDTNGNIVKEE